MEYGQVRVRANDLAALKIIAAIDGVKLIDILSDLIQSRLIFLMIEDSINPIPDKKRKMLDLFKDVIWEVNEIANNQKEERKKNDRSEYKYEG